MKQGTKMMLMTTSKNRTPYHQDGTYYNPNRRSSVEYSGEFRGTSDSDYMRPHDTYMGEYTRRYRIPEQMVVYPAYSTAIPEMGDYPRGKQRYPYLEETSSYRYMPQIGFIHDEEEYPVMHSGKNKTHGSMELGHIRSFSSQPMTLKRAKEWVSEMENTDGSMGQHWSIEQTQAIQDKLNLTKHEPAEFYATMNMLYSDYHKAAKKYNVDMPEFYACMADAFLSDADAQSNKLSRYYEYIVDHE